MLSQGLGNTDNHEEYAAALKDLEEDIALQIARFMRRWCQDDHVAVPPLPHHTPQSPHGSIWATSMDQIATRGVSAETSEMNIYAVNGPEDCRTEVEDFSERGSPYTYSPAKKETRGRKPKYNLSKVHSLIFEMKESGTYTWEGIASRVGSMVDKPIKWWDVKNYYRARCKSVRTHCVNQAC